MISPIFSYPVASSNSTLWLNRLSTLEGWMFLMCIRWAVVLVVVLGMVVPCSADQRATFTRNVAEFSLLVGAASGDPGLIVESKGIACAAYIPYLPNLAYKVGLDLINCSFSAAAADPEMSAEMRQALILLIMDLRSSGRSDFNSTQSPVLGS